MVYNFKLIRPNFTGNCDIKQFKISIFDLNNEVVLHKIESQTDTFNVEFEYK